MKIAILWSNVSGYMSACWNALAQLDEVELTVINLSFGSGVNSSFDTRLLETLSSKGVKISDLNDYASIKKVVLEQKPDIIVLCGWSIPTYRRLALDPAFDKTKLILTIDNPRTYSFRQILGRIILVPFLRRMDRIIVTGERSWQLAKYYMIPEYKIDRGCYGIDFHEFAPSLGKRISASTGWPKNFLFVGQFIERKGLDILAEAYSNYRKNVKDPWPLRCCGKGPLSTTLINKTGIIDHGFLQPHALKLLMETSGVFVLPSRDDNWPLAILEACASGLPVVCSEACGSSVEVIRRLYNGTTVPTGDVMRLSEALIWMHEHFADLPAMGRRSQELAAPYSADFWALRFTESCCLALKNGVE